MNVGQVEKRRLKITSGDLPASKFSSLSHCHPFSQQLDVVFPSNPVLLQALEQLQTSFSQVKVLLSDFVNNIESFVATADGKSNILAVSYSDHEDDVWCIDPRGYLTLSVGKDTYQRLGLVGKKLHFKGHSERHSIEIPLIKGASSPTYAGKVKIALAQWDERRQSELGKDNALWDVIFCSRYPKVPLDLPGQFTTRIHRVECTKQELSNVHIPALALESPLNHDPPPDWSNRVQSLFEWVGMASLGAQRLFANDRIDPYIAVYEPPAPSHVGDVTHLRWRGLLCPEFIQQVLDTAISSLDTVNAPSSSPSTALPFVSITAHAMTTSPVSYIPHTLAESGKVAPSSTRMPMKTPRKDGEDTWSLLLERSESRNSSGTEAMDVDAGFRWLLLESIGQWDTRWG